LLRAARDQLGMSIGSISDFLRQQHRLLGRAADAEPRMPGGHQPAPIVGTVFSTQSTMESDGLSIANFDLFSEPPPFAATIDLDRVAGHELDVHTAGVLSFVFLRLARRVGEHRGAQLVVRIR
jgi:hypothetical protein